MEGDWYFKATSGEIISPSKEWHLIQSYCSQQFMELCMLMNSKKLSKGLIMGFHPANQNTSFYSDIEIITVCGRPAICNLFGWGKSSWISCSLSGFCVLSQCNFIQTFLLQSSRKNIFFALLKTRYASQLLDTYISYYFENLQFLCNCETKGQEASKLRTCN